MLNSSPLFDQPKVTQLLNVLEEQQKLTPASRQAIEEIRSIVQGSEILQEAVDLVVPTVLLDEGGIIRETSEAFCRFIQKNCSELMGCSLLSLLVRDKSGIMRGDSPVFKGKGIWQEELCYKTSSGEERWHKTTSVAMPHSSNKNVVLILGQDITESKPPLSFDYEQDDYTRTVNALINLVFKVRYNPSSKDFFFVMFEGKLAREIELTTDYVRNKSLVELFGEKQAAFYRNQYSQAFEGKSVSYKHTYKNRIFYTTLSPVDVGGEIVEVIGSAVEVTMYENAESRIRHMAYHDPLTDLPNRRKLQTDLEQYIDLSEHTEPMTIMFCDLDRFKYVNDAMGHVAGDQVIKTMTERIRSCLDDDDTLYRLGGDEFVIAIRNDPGPNKTNQVGEKILEQVSRPIDLMGKKVFITMSIGVSTYPNDGSTSQELMGKADIAMHYCKMRGRDSVLFYTKGMNRSYNQLVSLEGDLREAISKKQLSLHYQPKVDVDSGYINGMEALVRWEHPTKGIISPNEFIPLAEETGLITQIDEWVLYEACRQNQEWIELGYAPERIAVNVSANEIQKDDFACKVQRILAMTGLAPEYLEVEVTENSVMQHTEDCIRTMQYLKSMGVSLAIDDFGTGYSSLSYLRQFPIHYLKIDQTFTKDVLTDPSDAEIVKAMIQLADAFKLGVVAEGVESEEVLAFLKENQCQFYQGYYFSRPLPPEEIVHLLTKQSTYTSKENPPSS
ncbi:sensor domain-containing protein [Halobacillus amylolyticus]|uniref:Bifunctional diguanylate cyclase/phosphodiesterase n=1 Tax=Halobacillus amylolyticus TaxID=2932259 RepID=A0ABY4HFX1_9BACI|nr:EAL domain-containing protein [Halobacillus amylolyticus]UOR13426.1 bifunctional diguanylate cyclase/phosphodiesterase [Halobacillus amylolyticus]